MRKILGLECDDCGPMMQIGGDRIVKRHVTRWSVDGERTSVYFTDGSVLTFEGKELLDFFEQSYFMGSHV
jgi:hypothetical protein